MTSSKIDRRVKYTKMMLKNSIIELLCEKAIEKITVKEICERADVNRGTFYSHYCDEYDLYNSIVDDLINGILDRLAEMLRKGGENRLKCVVLVYEYIKENSKLVKILLDGKINYNLDEKIKGILYNVYLNDADISVDDQEVVNIAYSFIAAGNIGMIKFWVNNGMQKSVEEMAMLSIKLSNSGFTAV